MFLKILLTAAAVTTLAFAQGGMGGSSGSSSGRGDMNTGMAPLGNPRSQKESKGDQIAAKLKLSKDQKTEFEASWKSLTRRPTRSANSWVRRAPPWPMPSSRDKAPTKSPRSPKLTPPPRPK